MKLPVWQCLGYHIIVRAFHHIATIIEHFIAIVICLLQSKELVLLNLMCQNVLDLSLYDTLRDFEALTVLRERTQ
jgi:hypothetical protein